MLNERKWDAFFERNGTIAKCRAESCNFSVDLGPKKGTNQMKYHLQGKHPELFKRREEAKQNEKNRVRKQVSSQPIISFAFNSVQSNPQEPSPKRTKIAIIPKIKESFNQWNNTGQKTIALDQAIAEMICVDAAPLSIVERKGFLRLLRLVAPQYKVKSRYFYTQTEIPRIYTKLKQKIIADLSNVPFLCFTSDAWSSKDSSHSLISLTAHFLDANMDPSCLVLAATPIKSHKAIDLSVLLLDVIEEFRISADKVHMLLRDAAPNISLTARLMQVESFDCFLHKLQLCVKDGFAILPDFNLTLENVKKLIRNVRKSSINREYLKELQESLELPKYVLIKATEVRWNSTYFMLERFLANKSALAIFTAEVKGSPSFSPMQWELMRKVVEMLKPIYNVTIDLQSRRATIASVVPIFRALVHLLQKPGLPLSNVCAAIANSLEVRMFGWRNNRNLCLATMLDPRYKLAYFEEEDRPMYRSWLEEVGLELTRDVESESTVVESLPDTGIGSLLESFLLERSSQPAEVPMQESEQRSKTMAEVAEYFAEPIQNISLDPFVYWRSKRDKWPALSSLVQKYLSAPPGSTESERFFSTASFIVNNLRKSLSPENLKMLLFLHHNLSAYNFEYDC